jgi:hypothetical protein
MNGLPRHTKQAMKVLDIRGDEFHPECNYSPVPRRWP